jgi:hypothetical protein
MVLTVPVRTDGERVSHSRRAVLRAALGAVAATVSAPAVTGCDSGKPASSRAQQPDPLNPLYAATSALLARYEATIAALPALAPGLTPLRDDHRQHLRALAREIGPGLASVSGGASGGPSPATDVPADSLSAIAALAAVEKEAATAARAACLAAPSYRAALLGSIAAARASHGEVLV